MHGMYVKIVTWHFFANRSDANCNRTSDTPLSRICATNIVECSTEHSARIRLIMTTPGFEVGLALLQSLCVCVCVCVVCVREVCVCMCVVLCVCGVREVCVWCVCVRCVVCVWCACVRCVVCVREVCVCVCVCGSARFY
jgi:hypothetical protein